MQMHRSTVVGFDGSDIEDKIRTSYGTFLSRMQDPILAEIERRIALWTKLNISHQEDIQVLRYGRGQKYGAHYDSLQEEFPRMATVILYLSDVEEGGETAFPKSDSWADGTLPQRMGPVSPCAQGHVAVKAKRGDALLFYSLHPDGSADSAALHTGCPVIQGVKWTGTVWIHSGPFRPYTLGQALPPPRLPDHCEDFQPECRQWASDGECQKNSKFMKGDAFHIGECRLSCEICTPCPPGDRECISQNRVRGGYLSLEEIEQSDI